MEETQKILLTVPSLDDQGGVASYYNGVLPYLTDHGAVSLEIGGTTKRAVGLLYPLADQLRFRQTARSIQPSLIHLNPSLDFKCLIRDGLFAWQTKKMNLPLLVFWHGWNREFEKTAERRYLGFFKKTFGRADAFIVLGSEFEQKLRGWGITAPIYRGTTCVADELVDSLDMEKKWLDFPLQSKIKILFLARLERAKGVFETVTAVRMLLDKGIALSLTIAGDGRLRPELEEYTRKLGLGPTQVCFTGDIRGNEKIMAFSKHHIYCFPTFYGEGLPTSVLEAMAFGMPVVTRPVGGLTDIFEDGKMGCLAQGKSPEEVANCLEKLIVDQNKMSEIGRYNAGYAREHFMASKVAKRLLGIYDTILADRAGTTSNINLLS